MTTLPNPMAGYDDWRTFMQARAAFETTDAARAGLAGVLGVPAPLRAVDVERGPSTVSDGIETTPLSWSVGYGPRTRAYLQRPEGTAGQELPGVVGLHCHGGYKWLGAEQLLDLGEATPPGVVALQEGWYGGTAPATELARRGFAVLVHDTFLWGSRRFPLTEHTPKLAALVAGQEALWREQGVEPTDAQRYNAIAGFHEDTVAKGAGVLGTSIAGMVAHDDLVALDVLAGSPGVDAERLGCFGFSGGGGRAIMLAALDDRIAASVVSCMMATFDSLTPLYLDTHSWLLNSPGLWSYSDLPDLVRGRSTLVQYGVSDALFPEAGMRAAHEKLVANGGDYTGVFYDAGHEFGPAMQRDAWAYLVERLA